MPEVLAKRVFTPADQESFAELSGDRNPMHMDPLFARRTQPGAPVVHGIHLLLWALDSLAAALPPDDTIRSVQAKFAKFVYVGEAVDAVLSGEGAKLRLSLRVGGAVRAQAVVQIGAPMASPPLPVKDRPAVPKGPPLDRDLDGLVGVSGVFALGSSVPASSTTFPSASARIGAERVAAIAGTSRVVGMLSPGLHSIYAEASFTMVKEVDWAPSLAFDVNDVDQRFRMIRMAVAGPELRGILKTFVRIPPVAQASMADLKGLVAPDEFAGTVALVIGGSRGLGELVAKLVASGGGHVVLTYRSGQADAEAVAESIRKGGGQATVLRYDAGEDAEPQLDGLSVVPTHAYYFATPTIYKPQPEMFSPERLRELIDIYVGGFWNLVRALRRRHPSVSLCYPSTVFVEDRPEGMTEYAMAKAAGETLCTDINRTLAPTRVVIERLPRLPTDQTASVTAVETASPIEILLPIVREVQSGPNAP